LGGGHRGRDDRDRQEKGQAVKCTGTMTRAAPGIAKEMQVEAFACELELDHEGPHTSGDYGWHGPPIQSASYDKAKWQEYEEHDRWWRCYEASLGAQRTFVDPQTKVKDVPSEEYHTAIEWARIWADAAIVEAKEAGRL
jgi:hypothetical protein